MKTTEEAFCEVFYRWWRDQTTPQKMTGDKAKKIVADCQKLLLKKLVPGRMTQEAFDEHLATAHKVILFGASWEEAKTKRVDDFLTERKIPKK